MSEDYSAYSKQEMRELNFQGRGQAGQIYKNRRWGDVEVLEYNGASDVLVKFLKTGYTKKTWVESLRTGIVRDEESAKTAGRIIYKQSVNVGDKFYSETYGEYEITDYKSYKDIHITFANTGYRYRTSVNNAVTASVRDKLAFVIEGIGCFGEGTYRLSKNNFSHKAYKVWREMLRRCHTVSSESYGRYGERGVTVCEEWRNFQVFAKWYEDNYKDGFQIEKDILSGDPKVYSPETCRMVPNFVNSLVKGMVDGKLVFYKGYQFDRRSGKYRVCMRVDGKPYSGSYYESRKDAFLEYKRIKEKELKRVAEEQYSLGNIDSLIYDKLINMEVKPHVDDEELF